MTLTRKPYISIVIPAYNEEENISHCLRSIQNQKTSIPFEVILVDNNSTDHTVEIAQDFTKLIPLKIIKEEKQGIDHARTTGFNAATGTVIARIDADSEANSDWIEKIHAHFTHEDIVGLAGSFYSHEAPLKEYHAHFAHMYFKTLRILSGNTFMVGYNCAFLRSAWENIYQKAQVSHPHRHEDFELATYLNKEGKVIFAEDVIVSTSMRRAKYNARSFFIQYPSMTLSNIIHARTIQLNENLKTFLTEVEESE